MSTDGATLPTQTVDASTPRPAATGARARCSTGQTPGDRRGRRRAAVELGTAFTPSVDGTVTAIRFYKGAGNTGTHTGSIWDVDRDHGSRTVTFTGETATGWQTATCHAGGPDRRADLHRLLLLAPTGTTP